MDPINAKKDQKVTPKQPFWVKNNDNKPQSVGENPKTTAQNQQKPVGLNQEQEKLSEKEQGLTGKSATDKTKELTETLQRLQAEFENFQKRNTKQNDEFKEFANAKLIEEVLPVLDSLEQGMGHNKELVLIHEQLYGILKKRGLEKIRTEVGRKFDHDTMECLMQEKNEKLADGAVANILINGYFLNKKILRLAKVSVNVLEGKKEEKESSNAKIENKNEEQKENITKIDQEVRKMEE